MNTRIATALAALVAMTGAADAQKWFTTDTPNRKANVVALILVHQGGVPQDAAGFGDRSTTRQASEGKSVS